MAEMMRDFVMKSIGEVAFAKKPGPTDPGPCGAIIKTTRPGGTISNVGYHGEGEYVKIPRQAWGVGMSDKTIRTALCPGGKVRMRRLLRLLETGRVDPTPMTTHTFAFDEVERAFHMMDTKEDGIIKPLIKFSH